MTVISYITLVFFFVLLSHIPYKPYTILLCSWIPSFLATLAVLFILYAIDLQETILMEDMSIRNNNATVEEEEETEERGWGRKCRQWNRGNIDHYLFSAMCYELN